MIADQVAIAIWGFGGVALGGLTTLWVARSNLKSEHKLFSKQLTADNERRERDRLVDREDRERERATAREERDREAIANAFQAVIEAAGAHKREAENYLAARADKAAASGMGMDVMSTVLPDRPEVIAGVRASAIELVVRLTAFGATVPDMRNETEKLIKLVRASALSGQSMSYSAIAARTKAWTDPVNSIDAQVATLSHVLQHELGVPRAPSRGD